MSETEHEKYIRMAKVLAEMADSLIEQVLPALSTIAKWYNELPQEIKEEIAEMQVMDKLGINKGESNVKKS